MRSTNKSELDIIGRTQVKERGAIAGDMMGCTGVGHVSRRPRVGVVGVGYNSMGAGSIKRRSGRPAGSVDEGISRGTLNFMGGGNEITRRHVLLLELFNCLLALCLSRELACGLLAAIFLRVLLETTPNTLNSACSAVLLLI